MSQHHPPSQPVEIPRPAWVALFAIVLLGIVNWANHGDPVSSLPYLDRDQLSILRWSGKSHRFPALGVSVRPPKGWIYLSVTDDAQASQPTFIHPASQSILRLLPGNYFAWNDVLELVERDYDGAMVAWTDAQRSQLALSLNDDAIERIHRWTEFDPRKIGRLSQNGQSLSIVAVSHQCDVKECQSVGDFCAAIEFTAGL